MNQTSRSDIKASVQKQFGQVAANYSTSAVHAKGADLAAMLTAAQPTGQERTLDAGCGTGHTALTFAPYVAQVVAVDFTEGMLEQGRTLAHARGLHNIEFRLADVEKLPFAAGEFDLILSRYSAHHWPHPQEALAEFARILKPGGQFILSDIVSFDDYICDTYLQAIELLRDPSHVRDQTVGQWLTMLEAAGFTADVVSTHDVWIDFDAWVQRMATPVTNTAMIRALFDGAPHEFRQALKIETNHSFTFTGAILRGVR